MAKSKETPVSDVLPANDTDTSGEIARESSGISREPVIYCGPSLPRAKIISGSLYRNGIPKNIEAMMGKIPEVGKLTVPVTKLAETQRRIDIQGSEENRLYQAVFGRRGEIENGV
jgi:hypothetical protein